MRTVIALYRLMREKRPPIWAWFLAAFVGIVLSGVVSPNAQGAMLASTCCTTLSGIEVALIGLAVAFVAVLVLVAKTMLSGEKDPTEPDATQQRLDAMCQVRQNHHPIVRRADRRGGPGQPNDAPR